MPDPRLSLKADISCTLILVIDFVTLIVLFLAAARATRIVVMDTITLPVRAWILKRSGVGGFFSTLVHCVTCSGFWLSAVVVGTWALWPTNRLIHAGLIALAAAEVAPRILNWEPRNNTGGQ